MSANKTSHSHLDQKLEAIRARRDIATERLVRLFRETFEDGDRALRSYGNLVSKRGIEAAIDTLRQEDAFFGRHWHYGWMRGGLLAEGNRTKALEHLQQLPAAMREHYGLVTQEWDLERALEKTRERGSNERDRETNKVWREPERERDR
nr:hypothetical protein [Pseudomonadota bacterium]